MSKSDSSIAILTEYFYPEEASTAQLMNELATSLTDQFDISVITGPPNYHPSDRSESAPRRETHDGVDITRVQSTTFDKDLLPLRVANWLTFSILTTALLLLQHRDKDALLTLSNPPIIPFAAWVHKRFTGTPYVYLIYDLYPDMAVELGYLSEDSFTSKIWYRIMQHIYIDADRIVVLGDSMRRRLEQKMANNATFDPDKIEIIPNWEDGDFIQPMDKTENKFAQEVDTISKFTLLYSGNIGRYHELETTIHAIRELELRGRSDVQLLIIGEGARKEELQRQVRQDEVENVRFLPFQPLDKLPETLTCGDASLVGIVPEMEGICVSSKLYSSLAAGQPILAVVAEDDEVARVVTRSKSGEHVTPGNVVEVADVIESWADNPELVARLGTNARDVFERNFTKEHAIEAYRELFVGLIKATGSDKDS